MPSVDLRLRHVSPLCAPVPLLRIAVGGSCVIKASRHLVFRLIGVARYVLAAIGTAARSASGSVTILLEKTCHERDWFNGFGSSPKRVRASSLGDS